MKEKQHLLIFISKKTNPWDTNEKIATIYMNKFVIDEDDANEIIGVHEVLGTEEISVMEDYEPGSNQSFKLPTNESDTTLSYTESVPDTIIYDVAFEKYIREYQRERASLHIIWAGQSSDYGSKDKSLGITLIMSDFRHYYRRHFEGHAAKKVILTFLYLFREFYTTTENLYQQSSKHGLVKSFGSVIRSKRGFPTGPPGGISTRLKIESSSVGDELEMYYTRTIHCGVYHHEFNWSPEDNDPLKPMDNVPICSFHFAMMNETEIEQMLDFEVDFNKTFYRLQKPMTDEEKQLRKKEPKHYIISMCHRKTYLLNFL